MNAAEGALYRPLVWVLAIGLVASGALLTIQMISTVVGPFRLSEIGASDPRGVVAFWQPPTSAAGAYLRSAIGHELVATGRAVREVTGLAGLDPAHEGSVVFSDARHLDATQLEELADYLAKGGGAVLVGAIATLDDAGAPVGTDAMHGFLGAAVVAPGAGEDAAIFAARRGPIAAVLAPEQQVRLAPQPDALALATSDAELHWVGTDAAASLRAARGGGRLAWLAVGPDAAASDADRRLLQHLQEAAIAWVSRTAWIEVLPDRDGTPPTTRRDEAAWALARGAVDASVRRAGPRRLIVEVTNNAQLPVTGLVLRVHLNEASHAGVSVESTALLQAPATLRPLPDAEVIDLVLPPLDARRSRAYSLDFESAAPDAG